MAINVSLEAVITTHLKENCKKIKSREDLLSKVKDSFNIMAVWIIKYQALGYKKQKHWKNVCEINNSEIGLKFQSKAQVLNI